MTFKQLQFGDVFFIDGAPFQCFKKQGRIVSAIVLTADFQQVPDPQDASGIGLRTTLYSDMRINQNNATAQECEAHMQELKTGNDGQ